MIFRSCIFILSSCGSSFNRCFNLRLNFFFSF
nr:MAG TPA: hypothetical protein [Caudoviricetes sp.]